MAMYSRSAIAVIGVLLLGGSLIACSDAAPTETAPTTTVDSVEDTATEAQLASVIAKYESDWRGAIEGRLDCSSAQLYAALPDATGTEIADAYVCLTEMKTAGMEAKTASAELGKLTPPASMEDLVADTVKYLDIVAATDLDTICDGEPFGAAACTASDTTSFDLAYMRLEQQLDAWGPYL